VKTGQIKSIVLLLVLLIVSVVPNAEAAIKPNALTITPSIAGHVFEGNEGLENSAEYGLGFGYNFNKHWAAELTSTYSEVDVENTVNDEVQVYGLRLDALYHFLPDEEIVPYFVVGGGGLAYDVDNLSSRSGDHDLFTNYGFGLKFFFDDRTALRLDARHFTRFVDDNESGDDQSNVYQNLVVSAGLNFQIGGGEPASERMFDYDDDGIVDSRDRCPDTPPGYAVDGHGCSLDSDRDGVIDALDDCPNTSYGVEVDNEGCPVVIDSDGDGVADESDDCPDTPAGFEVDERGCSSEQANLLLRAADDFEEIKIAGTDAAAEIEALAEVETLDLGIEFAPNSTSIRSQYRADLEQAAAFAAAHPGVKLMVEGHTDSLGSGSLNQSLSQKRADTVRWTLVSEYGVNRNRIVAEGLGESQPIADNGTKEGRARNRRVLIRVVEP